MMNSSRMLAARLHGPADLRVEELPHPGPPAPGHVLLRVTAVGVCGSDLHTYKHAQIGDTRLGGPLVLGHEFAGVVEAVGKGISPISDLQASAGSGPLAPKLDLSPSGPRLDPARGTSPISDWQPSTGSEAIAPKLDLSPFDTLVPGTRVAVDPAQPCGQCELCERGDPNLCLHLKFCGLWPDQGALCQWMHMPAHCCFPIPPEIDDATAVLLEPLGVAMHAVDLAKLRTGHRVAILGAGPIGLCILQLVRLSGAGAVYVTDKFPWRLELARRLGATAVWCCDEVDPAAAVRQATAGRGVDVAFEAAWCDRSVDQAAEMLMPGGRLMMVGIPQDDSLSIRPSTPRRKGLSLVMVRRMKLTYPRAIRLAQSGAVDLAPLVTHRFPLHRAAEAFALSADYRDGVVKVLIDV